MEWGRGRGMKETRATVSLALAADPIDVTAVNGQVATSTGKNGGAEVAFGLGKWYTLRLNLGLGAGKLCKWLQCSTSHHYKTKKAADVGTSLNPIFWWPTWH